MVNVQSYLNNSQKRKKANENEQREIILSQKLNSEILKFKQEIQNLNNKIFETEKKKQWWKDL